MSGRAGARSLEDQRSVDVEIVISSFRAISHFQVRRGNVINIVACFYLTSNF